MGVRVGRVVREGLERSAIVAFESRPRDLRGKEEQVPLHIVPLVKKRRRRRGGGAEEGVNGDKEKEEEGAQEEERQESLAASNNNNNNEAEAVPVWGVIAHPGWASPESPDLPNLHFEPVIAELGHLIEAKAVSLAPVDPLWQEDFAAHEGMDPEGENTSPDPLALWLLQRPVAMGLREYIAQLTSLGMITTVDLCAEFIELYERARFSEEPLRETEFRHLMAMFAEILRNMMPLPQATVDELHAAEAAEIGSDNDDLFDEADHRSMDSEDTTRWTPRPQQYSSQSSLGSQSSAHVTAPSRPATARNVSLRTGTSRYTTAPLDHRPRRENSKTSFGKSSTHSLRKMSSRGSVGTRSMLSSAGSVIRLADARSSLDLPYAYVGSSEERL